jgi:restriction endonuclease S subunit
MSEKKGQLQQAIEERRQQIDQLKAQRKALAKHIEIKRDPLARSLGALGDRWESPLRSARKVAFSVRSRISIIGDKFVF